MLVSDVQSTNGASKMTPQNVEENISVCRLSVCCELRRLHYSWENNASFELRSFFLPGSIIFPLPLLRSPSTLPEQPTPPIGLPMSDSDMPGILGQDQLQSWPLVLTPKQILSLVLCLIVRIYCLALTILLFDAPRSCCPR